MMINRIHILGASGSGTTSLASEISQKFGYTHWDTDDFFWEKTDPPFTRQRKLEERVRKLANALQTSEKWVLSGSLCGWGDVFIPFFDLVIFLWIPEEVRLERLKLREKQRYGDKISFGGPMYEAHLEFMEWALEYDKGDMRIRSKRLHYAWMEKLPCKILKIEEDVDMVEKIKRVEDVIIKYTAR